MAIPAPTNCHNSWPSTVSVGEPSERVEGQGMVSHNEVRPTGNRLLDHFGSHRQASDDSVERRPRVPHQQANIIPLLGQRERRRSLLKSWTASAIVDIGKGFRETGTQ